MIPPFDIFRVNSDDGALMWREAADTLEAAQQRARKLAEVERSQFLIVSVRTGNRVVVDPDEPVRKITSSDER